MNMQFIIFQLLCNINKLNIQGIFMIPMENSHSQELGELFGALSKAQGKIENAMKDKANPFFKSKYADLSSVWDACREPLSQNGLAVIQTIEGSKDAMFLITCLGHSSGQWMKSKLPLMVMKQDPQAVGSSLTYARRYSLSAMIGICADEDDDGEKAMGRKAIEEKKSEPKVIDPKLEKDKMKILLLNVPKEDHELINEYINVLGKTFKNKSRMEFIDSALSNFEGFQDKFNAWKINQLAESK